MQNQPFDEAHDLTSEGSVDENEGDDDDDQSESASPMKSTVGSLGGAPAAGGGMDDSYDGGSGGGGGGGSDARAQMGSSMGMSQMRQQAPELASMPERNMGSMSAGGKGGGDDDDDDDESPYGGGGAGAPVPEGMYDASEYDDLPVSAEMKELFQYIGRYKPHDIQLETKMRPFIPDYIPAVGDIDSFVKVPRPDGKQDNLGLVTLDEPASVQSDPTVLTLQLRAVSKASGNQPMMVRSIEHAEKDPQAISKWIHSISDLHRHKPAPTVRYSKPMPDIEALMQIWPAPVEELLEQNPLPDADTELDLKAYVRMVCAMLDIPVYGSLTESLHVLFTLYSDFKANVHFQQQLSEQQAGDGMGGGGMGGGAMDGGMGGGGGGGGGFGGGEAGDHVPLVGMEEQGERRGPDIADRQRVTRE